MLHTTGKPRGFLGLMHFIVRKYEMATFYCGVVWLSEYT